MFPGRPGSYWSVLPKLDAFSLPGPPGNGSELTARADEQRDVEEMALLLHEAGAIGCRADTLGPANEWKLRDVALETDRRTDEEVLAEHEVGGKHGLIAEGSLGVGFPVVEGPVRKLRDRDGAVDRRQEAERPPDVEAEPFGRHPVDAGLGADEHGLPVHEAVVAVGRGVRSVPDLLLAEHQVEGHAREEFHLRGAADPRVAAGDHDVEVEAEALTGVRLDTILIGSAEGVQVQDVRRVDRHDPALVVVGGGGLGVGRVLGHRGQLRGRDGSVEGLHGDSDRVAATGEGVGGGACADRHRPLSPFGDLVTGGRIPRLVDANDRGIARAAVADLRTDGDEVPGVRVGLLALADQPQRDAAADLPGDGDRADTARDDASVDGSPRGGRNCELAVLHPVGSLVAEAGAGGGDLRCEHDAGEDRQGEELDRDLSHVVLLALTWVDG